MHLCTSIPSELLAFELSADNTQEGLPPLWTGGNGICDFQQECQIWTRLTREIFSTFKHVQGGKRSLLLPTRGKRRMLFIQILQQK